MSSEYLTLASNENQARAIGQYAINFVSGKYDAPDEVVFDKVVQFHLDSVACAIAALGCGMNAPRVLREEALSYQCRGEPGATCFGSHISVSPEKAVLANCSAVRELDANGTNFGYNPRTGNCRGEFGHNDFYPVAMAAAQQSACDGQQTLNAMICLDEIRGRLAEVFALKDYKIDHVVHGAIASAAVYGAMMGATAEQIESAIGLTVAHYVPFRAIRSGDQLSDSKGASAAISAEVAVTSMRRAMRGFVGPADIFRNAQAIFCLFEPPTTADHSPFELQLATTGSDFAVMDMHFKLGLYEHQSAGAIQGLIDLLQQHPHVLDDIGKLDSVRIEIYEPAFSIIGDPAKRDPQNRQSADHSMVYIIATLLRKAFESKKTEWTDLMLLPADYDHEALFHPMTRELMDRIEFAHGGADYDSRYPDGIPTTLQIQHVELGSLSSGLVMYPLGHARNTSAEIDAVFSEKALRLAELGVGQPTDLLQRLSRMRDGTPEEVSNLYSFDADW